eukprot:s3316_g1.t1
MPWPSFRNLISRTRQSRSVGSNTRFTVVRPQPLAAARQILLQILIVAPGVEYEQWQDGPPAPPPEQMEEVTPEYVNLLMAPTEHFLCELEHNIYKIQFVNFKIRCLDPGRERVAWRDLG